MWLGSSLEDPRALIVVDPWGSLRGKNPRSNGGRGRHGLLEAADSVPHLVDTEELSHLSEALLLQLVECRRQLRRASDRQLLGEKPRSVALILLEQDGLDLPALEGLSPLVVDGRSDPFAYRGAVVVLLLRLENEVCVLVEEVTIRVDRRLSWHGSPGVVGALRVVQGLYANGVRCTLLHGDRQLR